MNLAVASKDSLFPRVSVKPAVIVLCHGYFGGAVILFVMAATTTALAGTATTMLVTVTMFVNVTVITLVTVTTLTCAEALKENAAKIPATSTDNLLNFINQLSMKKN
jgi:hypothetical protein